VGEGILFLRAFGAGTSRRVADQKVRTDVKIRK
jgi:hypothetical protein